MRLYLPGGSRPLSTLHTPSEIQPAYTTAFTTIVDVDRVISPVEATTARLGILAGGQGIDYEGFRAAQQSTENDGATFNALGYIRERLAATDRDPAILDAIMRDFAHYQPPRRPNSWVTPRYLLRCKAADKAQLWATQQRAASLTYPDGLQLLTALARRRQPHFLKTYGIYPPWQYGKLDAIMSETDLDAIYAEVMSEAAKGPSIDAQFDHELGMFATRGYDITGEAVVDVYTPRARLLDDKKEAHEGLPSFCAAGWVRRPEEPPLPSQLKGKLPDRSDTQTIGNLSELLDPAHRNFLPPPRYRPLNYEARERNAFPSVAAWIPHAALRAAGVLGPIIDPKALQKAVAA